MQRFYSVAYQQIVNKFSPYVALKFYLIYLKFVKIKCISGMSCRKKPFYVRHGIHTLVLCAEIFTNSLSS